MFIKCPCRELQELREEVKRLRELSELRKENEKLKRELNITRGYIAWNNEEYALAAYARSFEDETCSAVD